MEWVFFSSLAIVAYAYFGYPLLLRLLVSVVPGKTAEHVAEPAVFPTVTLIISAYNEEKGIEEKLLNSMALDYPRSKLRIVVVSDGSTDRTCEIVRRFGERGVDLLHFEGRLGKTACLNEVMRHGVDSEIVVFSDANSHYEESSLKRLARHFSDHEVGFVTGYTRYISGGDGEVGDSIGVYARIEKFTKRLEGQLSSCVGADGAMFAVRRRLYLPLDPDDINDLVIPLKVVRQGYRGRLDEEAYCTEQGSTDHASEFRRQVRIAGRTIRAVVRNADLANPFRYGIYAFQFVSHKFLKMVVPAFLLSGLLSNIVLATTSGAFRLLLVGHVGFYCAGVFLERGFGMKPVDKVISIVRTFVWYNYAITKGWIGFLRGKTLRTWTTVRP